MPEEESEDHKYCLRKLEMRVAPCWQGDESFKESEHSSLQVSSTQSPSTAEHELGNRRTPMDSFSSLSSPLDHSSVLKDCKKGDLVVSVCKRFDTCCYFLFFWCRTFSQNIPKHSELIRRIFT